MSKSAYQYRSAHPSTQPIPLGAWIMILTLCLSILLIGIATLHPFRFALPRETTWQYFFSNFNLGIAKNDLAADSIRNVFLFVPLGLAIGGLLHGLGWSKRATILVVCLASFGLSGVVESLQTMLAMRSATLSDVVANGTGGVLGYVLFRLLQAKLQDSWSAPAAVTSAEYVKLFVGVACAYIVLLFLFSQFLVKQTHLTNWDSDSYLSIGNERTGDRPWQGQVREFYILSKSISLEEVSTYLQDKSFPAAFTSFVAAYYCPACGNTLVEQTGASSLRIGASSMPLHEIPAHDSGMAGLESATPVAALSEQIADSSQFTLLASVAAEGSDQTGPARIISISQDTVKRNFTLGQEGADLVIRLRTPVTGSNGDVPEFHVPGIFTDSAYHQVVVTYQPPLLRVYVDDTENRFSSALTPEIALFHYLVPALNWHVSLQTKNMSVYTTLYYVLISIPFFILFTLIVFLYGHMKKMNLFLPNQKPEVKESLS